MNSVYLTSWAHGDMKQKLEWESDMKDQEIQQRCMTHRSLVFFNVRP